MPALSSSSRPPRWRSWLHLAGWAVSLWVFFGFIGPRLVTLSPSWQRYCQVQEEQGLDSGALYYTDVPVSLECERANRAAVMKALERRRAREAAPVDVN